MESGVKVVVFSQTGLKTYFFQVENHALLAKFHQLLSMQHQKMVRLVELAATIFRNVVALTIFLESV